MLIFNQHAILILKRQKKNFLTEKTMLAFEWEIQYARLDAGGMADLVPYDCYRKKKKKNLLWVQEASFIFLEQDTPIYIKQIMYH